MELLQDGTIIKIDDYSRVLTAVGKNPNGRYFSWYFIREYWYYLVFETSDPRGISEVVRKVTDSFDNVFLLEEVKNAIYKMKQNFNFCFILRFSCSSQILMISNNLILEKKS